MRIEEHRTGQALLCAIALEGVLRDVAKAYAAINSFSGFGESHGIRSAVVGPACGSNRSAGGNVAGGIGFYDRDSGSAGCNEQGVSTVAGGLLGVGGRLAPLR